MTTASTATDIISELAGVAPGSPLAELRAERPEATEHALARPAALASDIAQRPRNRAQELRRHHGLADEDGVVAAGLQLDQGLVVTTDDDHFRVGILGADLHHEVKPVEPAQAHVGHQQVEGLEAEQPFGPVEGCRAGHVVAGFAEQLHEPLQGVLVVVQPNVRSFSDDERSLVETVGALAARALDRSLRYDQEHATAVAFQRASLPAELPAQDREWVEEQRALMENAWNECLEFATERMMGPLAVKKKPDPRDLQ